MCPDPGSRFRPRMATTGHDTSRTRSNLSRTKLGLTRTRPVWPHLTRTGLDIARTGLEISKTGRGLAKSAPELSQFCADPVRSSSVLTFSEGLTISFNRYLPRPVSLTSFWLSTTRCAEWMIVTFHNHKDFVTKILSKVPPPQHTVPGEVLSCCPYRWKKHNVISMP